MRILKIHFNLTLLLSFFFIFTLNVQEKNYIAAGSTPWFPGQNTKVVTLCSLYMFALRPSQPLRPSPTWEPPLDGRAVAGINGFGQWSCGDCLVGQWHGGLARALAEEPPVGGPVFALQGATETGGAERVVQGQRAAARALGWRQCPAQGPPMVRMGKRRRLHPLPGKVRGHSETRGRVVPHGLRPRNQRGLAGLHSADVQRRDLDRGAGDLLVGQVLVQKTVHTTMYLFQIHLLVL